MAGRIEENVVQLPSEVWRMIRELRNTGLHGDNLDEVVMGLIRPALLDAVRAGFVKMKTNT